VSEMVTMGTYYYYYASMNPHFLSLSANSLMNAAWTSHCEHYVFFVRDERFDTVKKQTFSDFASYDCFYTLFDCEFLFRYPVLCSKDRSD